MGKHKVAITQADWPKYEANGYRLAADQGNWGEQCLLLVEVYEAKHERINQLERAYRVVGFNSTRIDRSYTIQQVDVLDRDEWRCYVSEVLGDGATFNDGGAEEVRADTIYASRQECAAGNAASLREKVRLLREAADNIEEFMLRIECPPAKERE